jgi:hypothetical protein
MNTPQHKRLLTIGQRSSTPVWSGLGTLSTGIPIFFYKCLLRYSGANWRASKTPEEAQAWGRALAKNRTVKKLRSAQFIFGDMSHHSNHTVVGNAALPAVRKRIRSTACCFLSCAGRSLSTLVSKFYCEYTTRPNLTINIITRIRSLRTIKVERQLSSLENRSRRSDCVG